MGDYILGDYMSWWDPLNVLEDYMVWMSQSEMVNDLMRWLYGYGKTLLYIRRLYGMGEPIRNMHILIGRVLTRTLLLCITWYELTNQNAPFALLCPYMVLKGPEILLSQNPHYPTTQNLPEYLQINSRTNHTFLVLKYHSSQLFLY